MGAGALLAVFLLSAQADVLRDARAALERGDFRAAEQKLRARPNDVQALSLLGAALDGQKRFHEAEALHHRALALAPGSAEVLSNYRNHLAGKGDQSAARNVYYAAGRALARAGEYQAAESFFARAVSAEPGNFAALYNLGVAASFAGHHERARDVLQAALGRQPKNVDVLYSLAYVNVALKQREAAVRLLAQAAQLAPQRADIHKLLAIVTFDLGALADSLAAWDRYLQLEPNDDLARRERGFTAVRQGEFELGIRELEQFLARHPGDALGHYELGVAYSQSDAARALPHLDQSLALKPDFVDALAARGSLYYRQGKPEVALADLERAASLAPENAINLDRLGQTYLALDRAADAVRVLRKAAGLAPEDSTIQLHFGRALAETGQSAESRLVMDRFRQLGPNKNRGIPAGLVEYLSLTPEQQRADYRARVEKAVAKDPADAAAQLRHLELLLEDGDLDRAAAAARRLAALKPGATVLAGAGRVLLVAKQYALAGELLEQAATAEVALDLAIATFHAGGASAGLARLDRVPESARGGDYYLARAQMLDTAGRGEDAASALEQALARAPQRVDLYQQAAAFLARNGQLPKAVELLDRATQGREILLLKAMALQAGGQNGEQLVKQVQNRWPEWHAAWVAQGIIHAARQRFEEARQALETAVALGARSPEAYYYLADSTLRAASRQIAAAERAIRQALKLAPGDPWIQSLAGRIAFAKGDYATAAERQREALRLRPGFLPAHRALAQAYAALGRKQEAQAELERVRNSSAAEEERPFSAARLLAKPLRDW